MVIARLRDYRKYGPSGANAGKILELRLELGKFDPCK